MTERASVFRGEKDRHDPPRDLRICRIWRAIFHVLVIGVDLEKYRFASDLHGSEFVGAIGIVVRQMS